MPMENEWINKVITALGQAGISARRGYPSGLVPSLAEPLAAVSIQSAQTNALTLTVQVYMPMDRGCAGCEDLSLTVAGLLRALGAECQVGQCSFGTKEGLFSLPVTAVFTQQAGQTRPTAIAQPQVQIDGVAVETVVDVATGYSCSAATGVDPDTDEAQMVSGDQRWTVTVEDLVASAQSPLETVVDGFTLRILRDEETEVYTGCCWSKITTVLTAAGIRRTRVAITCNEPQVLT